MIILLRLLLIGGIIFLAFKAWRMLRADEPSLAESAFEPTVQCKVCQVHVLKKDAQEQNGDYFCQQHRPPQD